MSIAKKKKKIVSSYIYDKRDDIDFYKVNSSFSFLDCDVPRRVWYIRNLLGLLDSVIMLRLLLIFAYLYFFHRAKQMFNGQTSPAGLLVS